MATENKTIDANFSVNDYKTVAILTATFVGAYAVVKFVDKLYGASMVINADNRKVEG